MLKALDIGNLEWLLWAEICYLWSGPEFQTFYRRGFLRLSYWKPSSCNLTLILVTLSALLCCRAGVSASLSVSMHTITTHPAANAVRNSYRTRREKCNSHISSSFQTPFRLGGFMLHQQIVWTRTTGRLQSIFTPRNWIVHTRYAFIPTHATFVCFKQNPFPRFVWFILDRD